jgi:hypothetical protein
MAWMISWGPDLEVEMLLAASMVFSPGMLAPSIIS